MNADRSPLRPSRILAIVVCLVAAGVGEAGATYLLWGQWPTDSVRTVYSDYWEYEGERWAFWLPTAVPIFMVFVGVGLFGRLRAASLVVCFGALSLAADLLGSARLGHALDPNGRTPWFLDFRGYLEMRMSCWLTVAFVCCVILFLVLRRIDGRLQSSAKLLA